jgi:hypothetical protein
MHKAKIIIPSSSVTNPISFSEVTTFKSWVCVLLDQLCVTVLSGIMEMFYIGLI